MYKDVFPHVFFHDKYLKIPLCLWPYNVNFYIVHQSLRLVSWDLLGTHCTVIRSFCPT